MKLINKIGMLTMLIIAFSATGHTQSPPSLPTITPPVFTPPVMAPPSIPIPPTSAEPSEGDLDNARWRGEDEAEKQFKRRINLIIDQVLEDSGITYDEYMEYFYVKNSYLRKNQLIKKYPIEFAYIAIDYGVDGAEEIAKKIILRLELSLETSLLHYKSAMKSGDCDTECTAFIGGKINYITDELDTVKNSRGVFSDRPLQRRIAK